MKRHCFNLISTVTALRNQNDISPNQWCSQHHCYIVYMLVMLIYMERLYFWKFYANPSRYSIWLDSKLRLQLDPLLILEYFLWRKGHEYAISNHYDRHCVWEEVMQNKKLNKYNHTIIDQQFLFYQADGLTRFNSSDPNKLLPSSNDLSWLSWLKCTFS